MTPDAVILGRLDIDQDQLLLAAKNALGRSISRITDSQGRGKESIYLTLLATLQNPNAEVLATLENPGHLTRHSFYSFLVVCDPSTRIDLIQRTPLAVEYASSPTGVDLCVVSADLQSWRTAVINCCSDLSPYHTRVLFDKILILFESEGLSKLWSHYTKKNLPDKTFKLLERR